MIIGENGRHRDEIYAMWQRNFHDPVPYADFYFAEVYGNNDILLNVTEGEEDQNLKGSDVPEIKAAEMLNAPENSAQVIRGMLHLNPYTLTVRGRDMNAHYIVGVATDEQFRRQGVMRELLAETFSRLRRSGESFTYLMPADENYYLPFDFRFGIRQLEQEIECFGKAVPPEQERFSFQAGLPEDLEEVCRMENDRREKQFAVCTRITPDYLRRMEKEVRSDFGRLVTAYRNGVYAGRFVMGAENDCMVLSQVVYAGTEDRQEFLHEALLYSEREYHYGRYQLILDETWKEELRAPGNYQGVRLLPVREKKIIMFRILDLEKTGTDLCSDVEAACRIRVRDDFLKEQDGVYLWHAGKQGSTIRKISADEEPQITDGGSISIAALTELIFGRREDRTEEMYEGLTAEGRALMEGLRPLQPCCIQEIV